MNLTGGYTLLWCTACPPVGTGLRMTQRQAKEDDAVKQWTDAELAVTMLALRAYEDVVNSHRPRTGMAEEWEKYRAEWQEPYRAMREKCHAEYTRRDKLAWGRREG